MAPRHAADTMARRAAISRTNAHFSSSKRLLATGAPTHGTHAPAQPPRPAMSAVFKAKKKPRHLRAARTSARGVDAAGEAAGGDDDCEALPY